MALVAAGGPGRGPTPLTFGVPHTCFRIVPGTVHALGTAAVDGEISCSSYHANADSFQEFSCVSCHEHRQAGRDPDATGGMDAAHLGEAGVQET